MFGRSSGLILNKEKSEAFWIGNKVESKEKPLGIKWTRYYIKCLGIWCGPEVEGTINKNYIDKIKKLKSLLNMWSQMQLSLKGKISILRSLDLPQILYEAGVLYIPEWVMHDVDQQFFNFLWSNKNAHVKKEVFINEICKGGLKMSLFRAMARGMKCMWVKIILWANSTD